MPRLDSRPTEWGPRRPQPPGLQVHLLGLTGLSAAAQLQAELIEAIRGGGEACTLLVCEHPFGFSIGREGSAAAIGIDRSELDQRKVEVVWSSRGGGTWCHHPGQLVTYLIGPAERFAARLPGYRDQHVAAMVATGRELGLPARAVNAPAGAAARCGQFGFIGLGVRDGAVSGGGILNVSLPRSVLQLVDWRSSVAGGPRGQPFAVTAADDEPAGAAVDESDRAATADEAPSARASEQVRPASVSQERMRPTAMAAVRECWVRHLANNLGFDRYHVGTGHPRLKRTVRAGYVFAE